MGAMPIYEDNKLIYYIVSKCYLLGQNIKYYEDGTKDETYEVFFPVSLNYERLIPRFDSFMNCINASYLPCIFSEFALAKEYVDILNYQIYVDELVKATKIGKQVEYEEKYQKMVKKYQIIEQDIENGFSYINYENNLKKIRIDS